MRLLVRFVEQPHLPFKILPAALSLLHPLPLMLWISVFGHTVTCALNDRTMHVFFVIHFYASSDFFLLKSAVRIPLLCSFLLVFLKWLDKNEHFEVFLICILSLCDSLHLQQFGLLYILRVAEAKCRLIQKTEWSLYVTNLDHGSFLNKNRQICLLVLCKNCLLLVSVLFSSKNI